MKLETCWVNYICVLLESHLLFSEQAILRKFGYNDQLQVSEEYFQDK